MESRIVIQKYSKKKDKFVGKIWNENNDHNDKICEGHPKYITFLGIVE